MVGGLVELYQCLTNAGFDGRLLVALADQMEYARALDKIYEPLHCVRVDSFAVASTSERHLAWLHAAHKTGQQVLISGVTQKQKVEVDHRN